MTTVVTNGQAEEMRRSNRAVRAAIILSLAIACLLLSQIAQAATTNQISQFGITWTFDKPYLYGQFANGDYWVVGPVSIIGINPPSVPDDSGRTMNGSMVDPSPTNGSEGYDNSMAYNTYDANLNKALNVSSGSPLILPAGSSLVSTISVPAAGARPQLQTAAVLTVLSSAPPAGSFRPPYSGTDKTIKYNKGQLNYSLLKSLAPVSGTPALADEERAFERPWIDHIGGWVGRYHHPADNMPDYGQYLSIAIGDGALMLNLNFTNAQKEKLLIGFVQVGIDFYGIAQAGGTWPADGGHCMGRLLPIQVAGLVLGDTNMLLAADLTNTNVTESPYHSPQLPKMIFQELQNTFYVGAIDVSITQNNIPVTWNPDSRDVSDGLITAYTQNDVTNKLPEYGIRHLESPEKDNRNWDATGSYRSINGAASTSHALAALIMGLNPYWNHDVFFDYHDRWFTLTGGDQAYQSVGTFCKNMWSTYRANYGPVWPNASSAPPLTFTLIRTNSVVISWPSPSTGFVLQQNPDLTTTNWSNCGTATDDGVIKRITNNLSTNRMFFRLKQQ